MIVRAMGLVVAWAVLAGCAEPPVTAAEREAIAARAASLARSLAGKPLPGSRGLVIRLMFEEDVDLDLYVTDPLLETVYFARHDSRTGGRIVSDVRCDTAGARVEEIRFPDPWPGRYRIGVDFPHRCDALTSRDPAPFALTVNRDGELLRETHGLVDREFFEVSVLEFGIEESHAPGPRTGARNGEW